MQRNTENNFSVGVIAELCEVFEKEDLHVKDLGINMSEISAATFEDQNIK